MRTEASWKEQQRAIGAAKLMAALANLEPAGVERFRADHPDFVPQVYWTGESVHAPNLPISWMQERNLLREVWVAGFPTDKTLELITTNLFFVAKIHASRSWMAQVEKNIAKYIQMPDVTPPQKTWPYQDAVMFLHVNPWRAKTCEWCGRRFIAEHPKARFCGSGTTFNDCFWAWRKTYKKKNQVEHKDVINKRQRQKYRLGKRNRRRPHRAKR